MFHRVDGVDWIGEPVPTWDKGIGWFMGGFDNQCNLVFRIHGTDVYDNPTLVRQPDSLLLARQYDSIVHVRRGMILTSIDGRLVCEYASDGKDIDGQDVWSVGQKALGLATVNSAVEFDAVELREITGQGKSLAHLTLATLNKPAPQDKALRMVDLIPLIDPAKDSFSTTIPGGRIYKENSPAGAPMVGFGWHGRLRIPYHPPAEYDLHVRFRRLEGGDAVGVVFSHGNALGEFQIGAKANTLMGFASLNGKPLDSATATVHGEMLLTTDRPYDLVVHVRNRGVAASINGQLVADHPTDWSDLAVPDHPETLDQALGLRGYGTKWMFEKIEIREITGEGKPSPRQ